MHIKMSLQTTYTIVHRSLKKPSAIYACDTPRLPWRVNQQMTNNVEHFSTGYGQFVESIITMMQNRNSLSNLTSETSNLTYSPSSFRNAL